MIYELRIYSVNEGKMDDLLLRFKNHTLHFFKKHNITARAFFNNLECNKLFYILQFENENEKERAWNSFLTDKEWIEVSKITNQNGRLISNIESYTLHSIELLK